MFGGLRRGMRGQNGQGGQGGAGGCMQQCSAWLRSIPIVTCTVVLVCLIIYIIEAFQDESFLYNYAINPANVLENGAWNTFFSSAFFHGSFTHVLFNMLFMACQGGKVEQGMGTIAFLGLNLLMVCVTNLTYLAIAKLLYTMSPDDFVGLYRHTYALGYSGILFGILVVDTQNTPTVDRVFCCCPIPAFVYPWVLFLVIQFMMPDISWLGHLSGIFMGYAYAKGLFNWLTLPLEDIRNLEAAPSLERLRSHARYANVPEHSYISNCQFPWTSQWHGVICKGACFNRCINCCNSAARNVQGNLGGGARLGGAGNGYSRVVEESVNEGGRRLGDLSSVDMESQQPGMAPPRQPQARPQGLLDRLDRVPRATESEKKARQQETNMAKRKAQAAAVNARFVNASSNPDLPPAVVNLEDAPMNMDNIMGQQMLPSERSNHAAPSVPALAPPPDDVAVNLSQVHADVQSSDDDIYGDI